MLAANDFGLIEPACSAGNHQNVWGQRLELLPLGMIAFEHEDRCTEGEKGLRVGNSRQSMRCYRRIKLRVGIVERVGPTVVVVDNRYRNAGDAPDEDRPGRNCGVRDAIQPIGGGRPRLGPSDEGGILE